jgi:hypothetical protein
MYKKLFVSLTQPFPSCGEGYRTGNDPGVVTEQSYPLLHTVSTAIPTG